jgi:hypothetical protein
MKKIITLIFFLIFSVTVSPALVYSASDYYPEDYKGESYHGLLPICNEGGIDPETGDYENPCGFDAFLAMINRLIDFITVELAAPLFAVIFTYAGFMYLLAGAKPDKKTLAKKIIFNSLKGFGLVLSSWIIVKTILTAVGLNFELFESEKFWFLGS